MPRGSKGGEPLPDLSEKDIDRFWSKVLFDDGCWEWQGAPSGKGYGDFCIGPRVAMRHLLAHRVAYTLCKGPIPPKLTVSHLCHNRRCVRPAHLVVEPIRENLRRSIAREGHRDAKLTEGQVHEIRRRWDIGGVTVSELVKDYPVAYGTIYQIVNRITWRSLPEES